MDWLPDELALAKTHDVAPETIAEYEARLDFDPTAEIELLIGLGLSKRDTLVEFGPGPGAFAVAAAGVAGRVIAVEPSPALCRHIAQRAFAAGRDNLSVANAGFLSYEHETSPADFVFTKNALHHLSDFWKMEALLRIASFTRPGGILRLRDLVFSFDPADAGARIAAWVAGYSEASGWSEEALRDHVRSEFSTYVWILERMLDEAGFDVAERWTSESGVFARYTCVRR